MPSDQPAVIQHDDLGNLEQTSGGLDRGVEKNDVLAFAQRVDRQQVEPSVGREETRQERSDEYGTHVADVKTTNSRRTIDLDPRTVAVLRTWRRQQLEQQMSSGRRDEDGVVFTRSDGESIHPDFFSQSWERLVRKSGLRRIRLHDLRHTHASILLKANVPVKVVSERLGHSSPASR